ncbi:hypothetical protein QJS10_CPB15g00470 [Acorus calamus]|uniref:Uncharacterized protein n=1 Tax=Acorus calamus TaxID=4465 RepID=A0AAV9D9T5_ACOCL|nr:hypothetical protein QJS10_CPB15g00470 [Acorus calamus]
MNAHDNQVYYDWTVSYSKIAPLGVEKEVIVINNQFPGPLLNTTTNDMVSVNVRNHLNEPLLFTWNGVQLRADSWADGVQGTNCPIIPGESWSYTFKMKDQIGSFHYFPSTNFQKAAGGYGPIRIYNHPNIPLPFPETFVVDLDILIGDWYNTDYREMRANLHAGKLFPQPDGIVINGLGTNQANFTFQTGVTYRLRISNVGLKTSLNFRIQGHKMRLVETEGTYTDQYFYDDLDVHVGQSYSVLVTANQTIASYYMIASSRFLHPVLNCSAVIRYSGADDSPPTGPVPKGPDTFDYAYSMNQARSIKMNLTCGAARLNPQGSYHYNSTAINRTIVLENGVANFSDHRKLYTVNGASYVQGSTPLKLADYFSVPGILAKDAVPDRPDHRRAPSKATSVIDVDYRNFVRVVFQNTQPTIQTWHIDGYSFFFVGTDNGQWRDDLNNNTYNMLDAITRSTVQVYPNGWSAVLIPMGNLGMWNLRSADEEMRYLGQQVYVRVKDPSQPDPKKINARDEWPIPSNVLLCG